MRLALFARPQSAALDTLHAVVHVPPRNTTSRTVAALEHCKAEWEAAYRLAQEKGLSAPRALRMASVAYKLAMPKMTTLASIRAYISCIAQGIQMEVFDGRDGSQLLYAAQVAMSTVKAKEPKKR